MMLHRVNENLLSNMPSTDDSLPAATYGFIGIGDMGCPMAWNLRKKIPQQSKLIICDIVAKNVQRCLAKCEGLGPVEVAANPKEITESCVRLSYINDLFKQSR